MPTSVPGAILLPPQLLLIGPTNFFLCQFKERHSLVFVVIDEHAVKWCFTHILLRRNDCGKSPQKILV